MFPSFLLEKAFLHVSSGDLLHAEAVLDTLPRRLLALYFRKVSSVFAACKVNSLAYVWSLNPQELAWEWRAEHWKAPCSVLTLGSFMEYAKFTFSSLVSSLHIN